MVKLIKVSAHDCPICAQLAYHDVSVAEDNQLPMEVVELGDLAQREGSLRDYIKSYHLEGDGSVTVPIYVIVDGKNIEASGEVKNHEELSNLVLAWKQWKAAQPRNNVDSSL